MKTLLFLILLLLPFLAGADAVDDLIPGTWYEVPNSDMDQVAPPGGIQPPNGWDTSCVMDCWCGGAFDTTRNILYVWGGGHGQYSGNELYGFNTDSLTWERITDPSIDVGGSESSGVYPDGEPRSRHTYNQLQYAASADRLLSMGTTAMYPGGQIANSAVLSFNYNTKAWNTGGAGLPISGQIAGQVSAYDSVTGRVWAVNGFQSQLAGYDPVSNSWTQTYGAANREYNMTGAIDPSRRLFIATGYDYLFVWDLANPGNPTQPSSSGDKSIEGAFSPGLAFDPVINMFVGWAGGSSVYTLDPTNWVWTRHAPDPSNTVTPTSQNVNGTYGRFRYIPSRNAYIAVNRTGENVYIYKLSPGGGVPTDPPDSIPPGLPPEVNVN